MLFVPVLLVHSSSRVVVFLNHEDLQELGNVR